MQNARWRSLVLVMLGLTVAAGVAGAGRGGKNPPPSPDPVDTGVIYAVDMPNLVVMDTDGTDMVPVGWTEGPIPSTALHGGERWFLVLREIENETYPSGNPRHELFAVTVGGAAVQLTNDPDIEPNYLHGWMYGGGGRTEMQWATCEGVTDGKVSYLAARWDNGAIVEYGIYVLEVDPDDLANHMPVSCGAGASFLPLDVTLERKSPIGMFWEYDWSPDGESVVFEYGDSGRSGLLVAHAADGWSMQLIAEAGYATNLGYMRYPTWSPDGTVIAFEVPREVSSYLNFVWDIHTIEPDGSNETTILTAGDQEWLGQPKWSPSGDYLVYCKCSYPRKAPKGGGLGIPDEVDVYRAAADGTGAVNLTGGTDGTLFPLAWVED